MLTNPKLAKITESTLPRSDQNCLGRIGRSLPAGHSEQRLGDGTLSSWSPWIPSPRRGEWPRRRGSHSSHNHCLQQCPGNCDMSAMCAAGKCDCAERTTHTGSMSTHARQRIIPCRCRSRYTLARCCTRRSSILERP